jgi:hypothetical protein
LGVIDKVRCYYLSLSFPTENLIARRLINRINNIHHKCDHLPCIHAIIDMMQVDSISNIAKQLNILFLD